MPVHKFLLGRMRLQRFNSLAPYIHWCAFDVGRVRADKERDTTGVRVLARKRMAHGRCVIFFGLAHLPVNIFSRQFPAMDHLEAFEIGFFVVLQCIIGGVHIRETGVAAIRRQRDRVQNGRHRRRRSEGFVRMPLR